MLVVHIMLTGSGCQWQNVEKEREKKKDKKMRK